MEKKNNKWLTQLLRKVDNDFRKGWQDEFTYYKHEVYVSSATNMDCINVEIDGQYSFEIDYDVHSVSFDERCSREVKETVILELYEEFSHLYPIKFGVDVKILLNTNDVLEFFEDRNIKRVDPEKTDEFKIADVEVCIKDGVYHYNLTTISDFGAIGELSLAQDALSELIRDRIYYRDYINYYLSLTNDVMPQRTMSDELGFIVLEDKGYSSMVDSVPLSVLEENFGTNALLVKWRGRIYDVSRRPEIYYLAR